MRRILAVVVSTVVAVSCSSSAIAPVPDPAPSTAAALDSRPSATSALPPAPTSSVAPVSTTLGPITITCDADAGDAQTFEIPLGTDVTLVAVSASDREYHLHGYDLELSGTQVTFQFTATIPGPSELTEHPGHSTVCTIVS